MASGRYLFWWCSGASGTNVRLGFNQRRNCIAVVESGSGANCRHRLVGVQGERRPAHRFGDACHSCRRCRIGLAVESERPVQHLWPWARKFCLLVLGHRQQSHPQGICVGRPFHCRYQGCSCRNREHGAGYRHGRGTAELRSAVFNNGGRPFRLWHQSGNVCFGVARAGNCPNGRVLLNCTVHWRGSSPASFLRDYVAGILDCGGADGLRRVVAPHGEPCP